MEVIVRMNTDIPAVVYSNAYFTMSKLIRVNLDHPKQLRKAKTSLQINQTNNPALTLDIGGGSRLCVHSVSFPETFVKKILL